MGNDLIDPFSSKELGTCSQADIGRLSLSLHRLDPRKVLSICKGVIYANFGDSVDIPRRQQFKDNFRLAMAIRTYCRQQTPNRILYHRCFLTFLGHLREKIVHPSKMSRPHEIAKIDKKAVEILRRVSDELQK